MIQWFYDRFDWDEFCIYFCWSSARKIPSNTVLSLGFLPFAVHIWSGCLWPKRCGRGGDIEGFEHKCVKEIPCKDCCFFFFRRSSRCSTCKSCKCAALCCPSLLQKFRLGTGDVAGVCLPALSRKEQALVFATGSTKLLLILVLVISGSCKLYTPSYIGKILQKWDA